MFNYLFRFCSIIVLAIVFLIPTAYAKPLVLGQVIPLSGVLGNTGKEIALGTKIYLDHINSQGGINGHKLVQVIKDDGYKVPETIKMVKEVIEKDNAILLLGAVGTGNALELIKQGILSKANLALVGPSSGADLLREPFNRQIFHVRASYRDEVEAIVKLLTNLGMKRIAVMYQDDPFGQIGLGLVSNALKKYDLEIIAKGGYPKNTDKVEEAVKSITASKAEAIIMFSVGPSTGKFIKQFRESGSSAQLFNISVVNPKDLIKIAGLKNVHGLAISQVMPFPYSATTMIVKEYQQMMKKYAPKDATLSYISLESYIITKTAVEGLRRAGPNPTRAGVIRALETMQEHDLGGFIINFSPTNHIGSRFVDLTIVGQDGNLIR